MRQVVLILLAVLGSIVTDCHGSFRPVELDYSVHPRQVEIPTQNNFRRRALGSSKRLINSLGNRFRLSVLSINNYF
jgi:hypothetical protein